MVQQIFVSSSGTRTVPATVATFGPGADGDVAPLGLLGGPSQSQLVTASGIAQDANRYLYVAAPVATAVNVYPPGASGDVAPFATIFGPNSDLTNPQGLAIHDQKLYVANGPFGPGWTGTTPSVAVFALPLAPGRNNLAPVAVIAGPATGLDSPFGLAVDSFGNIYVSNVNDTVTVYSPPPPSSYRAPADVTPILTITSGLTGPEGLAIKEATLYVASDDNTIRLFSLPTGTPGPVIAGPATTIDQPLGIDVDAAGRIYVVNTANQVLTFAAGATGNTAPVATIAGASTALVVPQFVYVGAVDSGVAAGS